MTIALISDVHLHNWSAYAQYDENGANSRLLSILEQIKTACNHLKKDGSREVIICGDLFHSRNSIEPSVFNQAHATFKELCSEGFIFHAIAGNHDVGSKDAEELHSAIETLSQIAGFHSYSSKEPTSKIIDGKSFVLIPWIDDLSELRAKVYQKSRNAYLVMHAPIDGVIDGLKGNHLTAKEIQSWGFKKVFSGHYHNHKEVIDGVYSVGALCHLTWSDVGSKAGYVFLMDDGEVKHFESSTPKFVDLENINDLSEVKGNYIRIKTNSSKVEEIESIKESLFESGALEVVVKSVPNNIAERSDKVSKSIQSGASLISSISEWVNQREFNHKEDVIKEVWSILEEVSNGHS